ncbi:MAG: putative ABC transporter permease [Lachnospiraceae bacterium]|nr:putative ABC transporter permease [Lachnospiraceae bacterium]
MKKFIHNFLHCGLLGWCLEIIFTAFHSYRKRDFKLSGMTSIWMFPIYGLAAFLAPVSRMLKGKNLIFRGLVYTGIIFTCEFVSGTLLLQKGLCPWNYERSRWNIGKVIRLDYTPCWFISGLLFERLLLENEKLEK